MVVVVVPDVVVPVVPLVVEPDVVVLDVVDVVNGVNGVLMLGLFFDGILTVVLGNIRLPPRYLASSVNFGFAAKIALTVVLFSFAIEDRVSPF